MKTKRNPCLLAIIANTVHTAHNTFMELNDKSIKEKHKIGNQQDIYVSSKNDMPIIISVIKSKTKYQSHLMSATATTATAYAIDDALAGI